MFKLAPEWKRILRQAWSIRFIALAALFSGLEIGLPFMEGLLPIPQGVFAALIMFCVIAAFVTRIIAQSNMEDLYAPTDKDTPKKG